jgi:uncharacterized GH25 family protein
MRLLFALFLFIAITFPLSQAIAHEYWLTPSAYSASSGETVSVQAFVGSDFKGELRPFATTRTVRLEVQTKERKDVKSAAINGDSKLTNLTLGMTAEQSLPLKRVLPVSVRDICNVADLR